MAVYGCRVDLGLGALEFSGTLGLPASGFALSKNHGFGLWGSICVR